MTVRSIFRSYPLVLDPALIFTLRRVQEPNSCQILSYQCQVLRRVAKAKVMDQVPTVAASTLLSSHSLPHCPALRIAVSLGQ
jgi:hypothetical protein